jgi:polyisoprenoid-binding protein YceI
MRYVVDPSRSRFTVQAFATGMLAGLGHSPTFAIGDFTSELRFDPENPAGSSIRVAVKAGSLSLIDQVSAKDRDEIEGRARSEVLEIGTYPEIVFQSTEIRPDKIAEDWYRVQVSGDLSLHGVKKPQQVDAQLRLMENDAHLSGRFTLKQSAFRIKPVTALGGMLKLKDEVRFDFDLLYTKEDR